MKFSRLLARKLHYYWYRNKHVSESIHSQEDSTMKWETPEYSDIRFGFEVTMYINNK